MGLVNSTSQLYKLTVNTVVPVTRRTDAGRFCRRLVLLCFLRPTEMGFGSVNVAHDDCFNSSGFADMLLNTTLSNVNNRFIGFSGMVVLSDATLSNDDDRVSSDGTLSNDGNRFSGGFAAGKSGMIGE